MDPAPDDVVPVVREDGIVHERRVAPELLQSLARLQSVDPATRRNRLSVIPRSLYKRAG